MDTQQSKLSFPRQMCDIAGGKVVKFDDHSPLVYGKEGYANTFFIAYAPGVELKDA